MSADKGSRNIKIQYHPINSELLNLVPVDIRGQIMWRAVPGLYSLDANGTQLQQSKMSPVIA